MATNNEIISRDKRTPYVRAAPTTSVPVTLSYGSAASVEGMCSEDAVVVVVVVVAVVVAVVVVVVVVVVVDVVVWEDGCAGWGMRGAGMGRWVGSSAFLTDDSTCINL